MKLGFSQQEIIDTAKSLGLPTEGFIQRRVARAVAILESNKVNEIDDGIFRVRSQYEPDKSYIVNVNHGQPSCDCPDGERTINCKHRIASLLYLREREKQAQAITPMRIRKRDDGVYCIVNGNHLVQISMLNGKLFCNCKECRESRQQADCKYKKAIRNNGNNGNGTKITNDCGTDQAKELQDKMNGQLDSQESNGNGAENVPSQQPQLSISDPFQECELKDIDQIEGRGNGDLAHKLSNGEVVISYKGIMTLAEKHNISFSVSLHDDTNTVVAKASNGNSRVSGKEVNICGFATTASELAKRNAARQLLPYPEIKAIEHKAKLNAEFSWQDAQAKCIEIVGTKANVDIIINDLVNDGKLRQDNPSHYDRTEWLIIYDACKQDASNDDDNNDGGDDSPSSTDDWQAKLKECEQAALNANRFYWVKGELQREGTITQGLAQGWNDNDFDLLQRAAAFDASIFNRPLDDDWIIMKERNWGSRGWIEGRMNRFWIIPKGSPIQHVRCFVCGKHKDEVSSLTDTLVSFERYEIRTPICTDCLKATNDECLTAKVRKMYNAAPNAVETTGLPKTEEDFWKNIDERIKAKKQLDNQKADRSVLSSTDDFVDQCKELETEVESNDDSFQANEQPLECDNGKRKLQMDKKLRTWLVETDGTKKEISCREICEQFESKQNPNIVTRLRVGIDSGADISTVELN